MSAILVKSTRHQCRSVFRPFAITSCTSRSRLEVHTTSGTFKTFLWVRSSKPQTPGGPAGSALVTAGDRDASKSNVWIMRTNLTRFLPRQRSAVLFDDTESRWRM